MRFLIKYIMPHGPKVVFLVIMVLLQSILAVLPALVQQTLMDEGLIKLDLSCITFCAILLVVIAIGQGAISVAASTLSSSIGESIVLDIRNDLIERLYTLPQEKITALGNGYIISRVAEVDNISSIFSASNFTFFGSMIQACTSAIILHFISPFIVPSVITICLVLSFSGSRLMKKYRSMLNVYLEMRAQLTRTVSESLTGRAESILYQEVQRERNIINGIGTQLKQQGIKQTAAMGATSETYSIISVLITSFVYIICGIMLLKNEITVGQVLTIIQLTAKTYGPLFTLANTMIYVQPAIESLNRIKDLFAFQLPQDTKAAKLRLNCISSIEANSLSIKKDGSTVNLLEPTSFCLKRPGLYVVKGQNGSGKTTLLNALAGFESNYTGSLRISGFEINEIDKESLRHLTSKVNQNTFLFNRTLLENILYGCPPCSTTKLTRVLQIVGLDKDKLEQKHSRCNRIGENGLLLSGGERQKVALARALLRNSQLILLDEPTTGLDRESVESLFSIIETIKKSALVVIVDHTELFDIYADGFIYIGTSAQYEPM